MKTIQEAKNLFEKLLRETTGKEEIRVYEKFLYMLGELENRSFSTADIQSIETELDRLQLQSNPENRKKYYRKALSQFEAYLKKTFSLTSKSHYTNTGIALGMSFGIIFGIVFLSGLDRSIGIALGLGFGMLAGMLIGRHLDAQAKMSGNTI